MLNNTSRIAALMVVGVVAAFGSSAGTAAQYDVRDFGSRTPSVEELKEALKPPVKMRGVAPSTTKPAVSLETKFAFNSAELSEDSKETLNRLGEALNSDELRSAAFLIEGHTDSVGSRAYNQVLSKRRADSVKNYLVSKFQIDPTRLKAVGRGKDDLLDKANPESGVNRRVQIVTESQTVSGSQ